MISPKLICIKCNNAIDTGDGVWFTVACLSCHNEALLAASDVNHELLAVLKEIREIISGYAYSHCTVDSIAEKAIAKAEGKAK